MLTASRLALLQVVGGGVFLNVLRCQSLAKGFLIPCIEASNKRTKAFGFRNRNFLAHLRTDNNNITWYNKIADADDDKEVEGCRSNNGTWTKTSGFKVLSEDFNDREHNLWCRRPENHQTEIGHCLIPHLYLDGAGSDQKNQVIAHAPKSYTGFFIEKTV